MHKLNTELLGELNTKKFYFVHFDSFVDLCGIPKADPCSIAYMFVRDDWSSLDSVEAQEGLRTICNSAAFLVFWGKDSERIHDVADDILMENCPNSGSVPIPTSWEDENTLREELWHFVYSYQVDDQFVSKCLSWVVVSLDQNISFDRISSMITLLKQEDIS